MIQRKKIVFSGTDSMPHYWKAYFSMSEIGKEYEILYDDEDRDRSGETLIMSNTEYEYYTNQRFFDQIKTGDKVLSVGYGIGLIVPKVKKMGGELTVVEKYQRVLELEKNLDSDLEIIVGDINKINFAEVFGDRKFDLIFSDTSESNSRKQDMESLLEENGKMMFWTHLSSMT